MAWLGKISNLGNLGDFAGAVNKLSESVKSIERNFDSALGFEAKSEHSEAPLIIDKRGQQTEPPVALVIQSKGDGNSQAEPSILNNVFGFARANFGNFEKIHSHDTQHSSPEADLSKTQNDLKSDLAGVDSPASVTLEALPSSQAEIKVILPDLGGGEETSKSTLESDYAEGSNQAMALPQQASCAPNENIYDNSSTENPSVEQLSASTPSEKPDELVKLEFGSVTEEVTLEEQPETVPTGKANQPKDQELENEELDNSEQDIKQDHLGAKGAEQDITSENNNVNISNRSKQLPLDIVVTETYVFEDEGIEQGIGSTGTGMSGDISRSSDQTQDALRSEVFGHTNETASLRKELSGPADSVVIQPVESIAEKNKDSKLKKDLMMMEAALQGAAKQAQMKADEISRLMTENEELKSALEDLKDSEIYVELVVKFLEPAQLTRKSSSMELDALREEYQQRVGAAERKVYALTKERDMLRREQSRKSDSSLLLKEKDEIIKQVMAEGEELSKKQAVQESTMRRLRGQIRELEEEKQRLNSRLQVEEGKVESMRKDKAVTETALQEAVEKGQAELAALRDYYTVALSEAKEAEAKAEARADSEAKADLERRCREAADRETTLLQNLDDLRQALSQTEQQAAFREDMHRKDLEDLERRYQASESRYEELVANVPDSTRPLLRQIEALQESIAMRVEAWSGVERSLNSRLQEAEAKAAAAQERERASSERLSQTLSRMAVMEAQLSMLRAEQSQLTRSLEKERQRASESRQEYLAATEMATTQEGRAKQLEEEMEEMRIRHKQELKEERARRHALEQDIDQEKAVIAEFEKRLRTESRSIVDKGAIPVQQGSLTEFSTSNKTHKRLPSVSSAGSVEESFFLQASTDSDGILVQRLSFSDRPPSPYVRGPGASLEQLESQLRQKEGELSSCFQRLASLESTRDSLAEELVRATTQCEALRTEASLLLGLRAELESLRGRHTSALELMGERDEQVEELKADLADVKQMYREQITMLVSQIEKLSAAIANR